MLLFADHALGDLRRWWNQTGQHLTDGPTFFEVFEFVCRIGSEGHTAWSLLEERGGGNRPYTVLNGLVPVSIRLTERGDDLVVADIRVLPIDR